MKLTVKMLMLLLLSGLFFSCKKDQLKSDEEVINGTYPVKKVLAWLDAEKAKAPADSAKLVDVLKQNLLVEEISEERLNDHHMVIIPLKNNYKTTNTTDLLTFKKLVLNTANGEIVSGNIIELIQKSGSNSSVKLSVLLNKQALGFNGIISNLSIFGKFKSEDVYKDGKLYSRTEIIKKPKTKKSDSSRIKTDNFSLVTCYDWYIITTFFNRDGSIAFQTFEYIGTTCTGDVPCELNRVITNTKSYFNRCGGGGSGGGGGGGEELPPGCDATAEYPEKAEFENYIAFRDASPNHEAQVSSYGPNPITGVMTIDIVAATYANWKIKADIRYGYYHEWAFDGTRYNHFYDLYDYHCGNGYYTGTNNVVKTTYTTTTPTTNMVTNNNTPNCMGISQVVGTITHKLSVPIRIPFCDPLELDQTYGINRPVYFHPK